MNTFPLKLNLLMREGHAGWLRRALSLCIVVNLRFLYSLHNKWHRINSNVWEFTTHCSLVSIIILSSSALIIIIIVAFYGYSMKDIKGQTISTLIQGWVKQIPLILGHINVENLTGDILYQQVIVFYRYVYYRTLLWFLSIMHMVSNINVWAHTSFYGSLLMIIIT